MAAPLVENGKPFNPFAPQASSGSDMSFGDIMHILWRQKGVILLAVFLLGGLATAYSLWVKPVFEAQAIMKKEDTDNRGGNDDELTRILTMQQAVDQIETEAELIKSRVVMERVVELLDLYFKIDRIFVPDLLDHTFDIPLAEYQHQLQQYPQSGAPRISVVDFHPDPMLGTDSAGEYFLRVHQDQRIALYEAEEGVMIDSLGAGTRNVFSLPFLQMSVHWPMAKPGSELHFSIDNVEDAVQSLLDAVDVETPTNTSLLHVQVQSTSPYIAQQTANAITDKYREVRIEHKRETISYSSRFVDDQLEEVSTNLQRAEEELSSFRAANQITSNYDQSSQEAVEFLSTLEADRIQTELQLTENRTRYQELEQQMLEQGYFDQTYLAPEGQRTSSESPFSNLMNQLASAQLRRLDLLQRRTANHPDVIEVDEQIAEIKTNLAEYNRNTLTSYRIIINSLESKLGGLNQRIAEYDNRARSLARNQGRLMELMRTRDTYEKMFVLLSGKREEMRIAELSKVQDIVIVEAAALPLEPILPDKKLNVLMGLIAGMLLGLTFALIKEYNSKTVTNLREVEDDLMMPILAIMPKYPSDILDRIKRDYSLDNHMDLLTDTQYGFKESYRMLRTKLSYILSARRGQTRNNILFTSCEENTGKTTVVTNYSLLLALAGKRILVIDCDLKNPTVGRFFGIPFNAPGLIDFLMHDYIPIPDIYTPLEKPAYQNSQLFNPTIRISEQETRHTNQQLYLDVIPAGGSVEHSSELLDSDKFRSYLLDISGSYDFVLIDTPPVSRTVDALMLGSFIKNVVMVVRPNHTRKDSLTRSISDFRQFNVHLLGSVINACDIKHFAGNYGYGYGYGYTYQYGGETPALPEATTVA